MLEEIREDEAAGETAAIYASIRATLGAPVVNYIWRHLATIEGALPWCWGVVSAAAPLIQAAIPASHQLTGLLIVERGLHVAATALPPPAGFDAVVETYNRGNAWNLLSMTLLAAARSGHFVDAQSPGAAPPALPALDVPPYPRAEALDDRVQACIARLAGAGPAAASGVRPSLWVHLGLWPDLLTDVERRCHPVLASSAFAAAHAELLRGVPGLLGVDVPAPSPDPLPGEAPTDRAIRVFRRRIAEMVLIGRMLAAPSRLGASSPPTLALGP